MTIAAAKSKSRRKPARRATLRGGASSTGRSAGGVATAKVDAKGRVTLGKSFANSLVIIKSCDDVVEIVRAEAVPAREAWLFKNKRAYESVMRGLEQAARGEFVEAPDLEAGRKLADEIED